ncbi:MAG: hypothetical protein ACRDDX_05660 [Cellulosilyticaceae bacterium]
MKRMISYNISESFNLVRWCMVVIVFAFVAVVSVAKYVQIADMTELTFSSLEVTYLILNDTTSLMYIYLPLYLFLICGIMFDDNFGSLEIIKCGTRGKWVFGKFMTLIFYTVMYFIVLFGMNFMMSHQVFPYSNVWSSDFLKVQVMMGQQVQNFVYPPLMTIGLSICSVFFLYMCSGSISVFLSLVTNKEAYALFGSLVAGLGISAMFLFGLSITKGLSVQAFVAQNTILVLGVLLMSVLSIWVTRKKDFHCEKRQ